MQISRRDLLKMTGAGAAAATLPGKAIAAAGAAGQAVQAGELFAVVSPGQAWGVFSGYHEAYHHASMIRHSGGVCTSHVRCSPAFADRLRQGTLNSFVEIDGWAVTTNEAEARGFQFLRRAVDRARARNQLHQHHVAAAFRRIEAFDQARSDTAYYVCDRQIEGAAPRVLAVFDDLEAAQQLSEAAHIHSCSPQLAALQRAVLDDGEDLPRVIRSTSRHTTIDEHQSRLRMDPLYRLANGDGCPAEASLPANAAIIAFDRSDRWIYGQGGDEDDAIVNAAWSTQYRNERQLVTAKASKRLIEVVSAKGLEGPGFWKVVKGIARHESELSPQADATPSTRRAIRPPRPEWKTF